MRSPGIYLASLFGVIVVLCAVDGISGTIRWSAGLEKQTLGGYFEYLEDRDGTLELADLLSGDSAHQWVAAEGDSKGFGFTKSVYWVRFSVENPGDDEPHFEPQ